jgi:signal transduction histidine kinase
MPEGPRASGSLRRTVSLTFVASTTLVLAMTAALLMLTGLLSRSAEDIASAVESVYMAEHAEVQLLMFARTQDPLLARDLEQKLQSELQAAQKFVTTPSEGEHLVAAQRALDAYIAARPGNDDPAVSRALDAALDALRVFVDVNVEQAALLQKRVKSTHLVVNLIGGATASILLVWTLLLLWWMRARALSPMLSIAQAMARFSAGDRDARAPERGPSELSDMARRFNDMATELTRQRDAQFSFFAAVAHDLRNPLGVLKLSLSRLTSPRTLPPEEKVRGVLETAGRQLGRLERMVNDIMDASRIAHGQLELQREPRDLRDLVREATSFFQETSDRHTITVTTSERPLIALCDPLRIEQVLSNLVSNAVKYSPQGGRVEVRASAEDSVALLSVTDQGIGMRPADAARLFEPFQRVGPSRDSIPGVGLGLFAVKRIVESHGGAVRVHSVPGEGSTFEVRLPLSERAHEGIASSPVASPP